MRSISLADWKPTEKQIKDVNKVLKTGRLTYGPFTQKFEEIFAKEHNFKYAIFTNSGTSALQVAWDYLKEINKWPDFSEVLMPAVTFVATANVLIQNRLTPVLVDIDPKTFNIDIKLIENRITAKTVAICPVDLLGRPVDISAIRKLAKKYKLLIVEDSCETMFVTHPNGNPVGSGADIAVYSSYLAHIISTGVGGFLCTNNKKWSDEMRSMIWHGRDNYYLSIDDNKKNKKRLLKSRFLFNRAGYSYRLTEMEAAVGIDEVERADEIILTRMANAHQLELYLREFQDKIILPVDIYADNAWMFFPIICREGVSRDDLCLYLEEHGIQTRYIMPLTYQPVYKGRWKEEDYPVADWVNKNGFLVGIHHFLMKADLKYIAKCFKEYFK